jgi:hypothetical protein
VGVFSVGVFSVGVFSAHGDRRESAMFSVITVSEWVAGLRSVSLSISLLGLPLRHLSVIALAIAGWGSAACGQPGTMVMDATTGDAPASADGGTGADATPPGSCMTATVCDGPSTVRACRSGVVGEPIETCDPGLICSRGRCTSSACAQVETDLSTMLGCRFYTLQIDNVTAEMNATSSLLVTNPSLQVATVQLERRTIDGWTQLLSGSVAPLQSQRIILPARIFEGAGYLQHEALRFSSDVPVTAAHVQSDDAMETGTSSGGTMLLPVQALGRRYMAVSYPQVRVPKIDATPGSLGGAGQVLIIGTEDMSNVTFQVSATASLGKAGGAPVRPPGGSFDLTLQEGDAYEIFSINDGDDLTGSLITADQPIAVLAGNISTTYGRTAPGINTPDMAHEQLLPDTAWGRKFVAAALPPQPRACDGVLGVPGASLWRIVAAADNTLVDFDAPPGVTGLPGAGNSVSLAAGGVLEVVAAGGSFTVNASAPVQVMQGMDCEPTMSSAINASAPMLSDLRFAVLPNFDQLVTVVRPTGAAVALDEGTISDVMFAPAGAGFEVAQVTLPTCAPGSEVCTHHLAGQFGMTLRGMDVVCSYALTAMTWVYCADPSTPGCIP